MSKFKFALEKGKKTCVNKNSWIDSEILEWILKKQIATMIIINYWFSAKYFSK